MNWLRSVGVALVALSITASVGYVLAHVAEEGTGPKPPTVLGDPGPPMAPTLTHAQERAATSLVQRSDRVNALTGGKGVIQGIGVWIDPTTQQIIGAVVTIRFPEPLEITGEWPTIEHPQIEGDAANTPNRNYNNYTENITQLTAKNVTSLYVWVDFARQRVVQVTPDLHAEVILPPGMPTRKASVVN